MTRGKRITVSREFYEHAEAMRRQMQQITGQPQNLSKAADQMLKKLRR